MRKLITTTLIIASMVLMAKIPDGTYATDDLNCLTVTGRTATIFDINTCKLDIYSVMYPEYRPELVLLTGAKRPDMKILRWKFVNNTLTLTNIPGNSSLLPTVPEAVVRLIKCR